MIEALIEALIERLRQASVELDAENVADAIWLAHQMGLPLEDVQRRVTQDEGNDEGIVVEETDNREPLVVDTGPMAVAYTAEAAGEDEADESPLPEGLPFRAPAAPALQNTLSLGRALRPLMRKVPSPHRMVIDEAATVRQIVEQQIWQPVLAPEPERWLDVELVVEDSELGFIWSKTIEEFRGKVLERQGAFRQVRVWSLQAGDRGQPVLYLKKSLKADNAQTVVRRSPRELIHTANRGLILLVTDCQSDLWKQSQLSQAVDPTERLLGDRRLDRQGIHGWLAYWAEHGPVGLVQLLPEWLWGQSALGLGFSAQLSAFSPGVPNTQLVVKALAARPRRQAKLNQNLCLPAITLEARSIAQWASVLAGMGSSDTPGYVFDLNVLQRYQQTLQNVPSAQPLPAETLVEQFLATASPTAQQLAGLMAAAPVSLSVVNLIQSTPELLMGSTPVHVAEVYMSGLLVFTGTNPQTGQPTYEFKPGIRQLLNQAMPYLQTERVLNAVSKEIAEELGLNIDSFAALLRSDLSLTAEQREKVLPFAKIALDVLRGLGGYHAELANRLAPLPPDELPPELPPAASQRLAFPPLLALPFNYGVLVDDGDDEAHDASEAFPPPLELVSFQIAMLKPPPQTLEVFKFSTATITDRRTGLFRRRVEWVITKRQAQSRRFVEALEGDFSLEMVAIPGGRFLMGSPAREPGRSNREWPQHEVTVPDFFMGRYPVTQAQWRFVTSLPQVNRRLKPNPSRFAGARLPVEEVSWYDATEFCDRLTIHTNRQYRLPSEAEWEYACRAGTTTPFYFGKTLMPEVANYDGTNTYANGPTGEYRQKTTPVDVFDIANAFGLCDMHGNVWEWCADYYGSYEQTPTDGSAFITEDEEAGCILRGGSWNYDPGNCRSAFRSYGMPDLRNYYVGFRVSCSVPRT